MVEDGSDVGHMEFGVRLSESDLLCGEMNRADVADMGGGAVEISARVVGTQGCEDPEMRLN